MVLPGNPGLTLRGKGRQRDVSMISGAVDLLKRHSGIVWHPEEEEERN
jgi:hypothetical protein